MMSGGMGMGDMGGVSMKPYLHFTPGDALWFMAWTPSSSGAVFGACFGLFLLSLGERLLNMIRAIMEAEWAKRVEKKRESNGGQEPLPSISPETREKSPSPPNKYRASRLVASSLISTTPVHIRIHRGILFAVQSAISYLLMLAVMTYNASFIFSVLIGLGVGEMLFGTRGAQYGNFAHHH